MAIRPARSLPLGSASAIEFTLLTEQDKWTLRMLSPPNRCLRCGNFLQCSAEMHGGRLKTLLIRPGNRPIESPIELERRGAITISVQPADVACRKHALGNRPELRGAGIEQINPSRREVRERAHQNPSLDPAPKGSQKACKRPYQGKRSPGGDRPFHHVPGDQEYQPNRAGDCTIQGENRMRGASSQQGTCTDAAETPGERHCRSDRSQSEPKHQQRMIGNSKRREGILQKPVRAGGPPTQMGRSSAIHAVQAAGCGKTVKGPPSDARPSTCRGQTQAASVLHCGNRRRFPLSPRAPRPKIRPGPNKRPRTTHSAPTR